MKLWKRARLRKLDKALEAAKAEQRREQAIADQVAAETAVDRTRRQRKTEEKRQVRIGEEREHHRTRILGYRTQRGLSTVQLDTSVVSFKSLPEGGGTGTVKVKPMYVFGKLEQLTPRQRRRLRHKHNRRVTQGYAEGVVLEDLFRVRS